jgi:hypothetical protein
MINIVNILRGQRLNLTDFISDISEFQLSITANTSGLLIDYSCFGLDINRELSSESYMTFGLRRGAGGPPDGPAAG